MQQNCRMFVETKRNLLSSEQCKYKLYSTKKGNPTMADNKKSLSKKVAHAGGWAIAKRVAKSVPYVGTVMAIGLVGFDIKNKGVVKGILNSGIDAIPVVGFAKNAVEFFTGDFFPDKPQSNVNSNRT